MDVTIDNLYTGAHEEIQGTPGECLAQLVARYDFLAGATLREALEDLDHVQALDVTVRAGPDEDRDPDMALRAGWVRLHKAEADGLPWEDLGKIGPEGLESGPVKTPWGEAERGYKWFRVVPPEGEGRSDKEKEIRGETYVAQPSRPGFPMRGEDWDIHRVSLAPSIAHALAGLHGGVDDEALYGDPYGDPGDVADFEPDEDERTLEPHFDPFDDYATGRLAQKFHGWRVFGIPHDPPGYAPNELVQHHVPDAYATGEAWATKPVGMTYLGHIDADVGNHPEEAELSLVHHPGGQVGARPRSPRPRRQLDLPLGKAEASHVLTQAGAWPYLDRLCRAAEFLGGHLTVPNGVKSALWDTEGDPVAAVLRAYGFPDDGPHRASLEGAEALIETPQIETPETMAKAEGRSEVVAFEARDEDLARVVRAALATGHVRHVRLGGKYSGDMRLVEDPETLEMWLLKPGTNRPSPAAGVAEERASQSRREAAFYRIAQAWGLADFIPRTALLIVDGVETACIRLLGPDFGALDRMDARHPGWARQTLRPFLDLGYVHRWAILDLVAGNPDRHGQNLMSDGHQVFLIDQGSAFAGPDFDPGHDQASFVPYYLRAWAPEARLKGLPDQEAIARLPRVPAAQEEVLRHWLSQCHAHDVEAILYRYGIQPGPEVARLALLKQAPGPLDAAVDRAWVQGLHQS